MKERIGYYDLARGLGIIFVVIGHIDSFYAPVRNYVISFHMALFLLVSGMLLGEKKSEDKALAVVTAGKFRTIMLPYFLFSFLSVAIEGIRLLWKGVFYWPHLESLLLTTVTLQGISVMWFLPALFISEVVFLVIRKGAVLICQGKRRQPDYRKGTVSRNKYGIDVLTSLSVFLLVLVMVKCHVAEERFYMQHAGVQVYERLHEFLAMLIRSMFCSVFICIGYLVRKYIMGRKISAYRYGILSVIFLMICAVMLKINPGVDLRSMYFGGFVLKTTSFKLISSLVNVLGSSLINLFMYLVSATAGGLGIIFLCKAFDQYKELLLLRVLIFFGSNSLIIMATHLDFHVLHYSMELSLVIQRHIQGTVLYHALVLTLVFAMEAVIIFFVNRFFPILKGNYKNK